mgnify:CR=1 FL=1
MSLDRWIRCATWRRPRGSTWYRCICLSFSRLISYSLPRSFSVKTRAPEAHARASRTTAKVVSTHSGSAVAPALAASPTHGADAERALEESLRLLEEAHAAAPAHQRTPACAPTSTSTHRASAEPSAIIASARARAAASAAPAGAGSGGATSVGCVGLLEHQYPAQNHPVPGL